MGRAGGATGQLSPQGVPEEASKCAGTTGQPWVSEHAPGCVTAVPTEVMLAPTLLATVPMVHARHCLHCCSSAPAPALGVLSSVLDEQRDWSKETGCPSTAPLVWGT